MPAPNAVGIIELVTRCGDHAALERIAAQIVNERLAACAHVRGPFSSTYRWNGTVAHSSEWELDAVSTHARAELLSERITALHPYELPAVVIRHVHATPAYAAWVAQECRLA